MEALPPASAWLAHPVTLVLSGILGLVSVIFALVLRPVMFNGGKFPSVPGSNFLVGHLLQLAELSQVQNIMDGWCEKHGMAEYRLMNQRYLLVTDPAEIDKLNKLRPTKVQRFHVLNELVDFGSPGVFSAEVPVWGPERRIVSPAFSHANLSKYIPAFRKIGARLHAVLTEDGGHGKTPMDTLAIMQLFTADVISILGFGQDTDLVTKRSADTANVAKMIKIAGGRMLSPVPYWRLPLLGPYLDGAGFLRNRLNASMGEVVRAAKAERANGTSSGTTILDKLIDGSESEGGVISDVRLAGNVNTLFAAGMETTAITITWMLYDLAQDPQLQADARAEAIAAGIDDESTFEGVLAKLPLLRSLFQEELRLRGPAGQALVQNSHVPIEIAGRVCEPGEYVFVWPIRWFALRPEVCPDPKRFIARRWLSEDGRSVKPMPSLVAPFGGSARICPGKDFAVVEALVCVSDILLAYDVEMPDPKALDVIFNFVLKPSEPVMLSFYPR